MKKIVEHTLSPEIAYEPEALRQYLQKQYIQQNATWEFQILKRSIDARHNPIKVNLQIEISQNEPLTPLYIAQNNYTNVSQKPQAIIVGAGPAGLFAALRLIELGIKPIVLERGKDVRSRRRDLAAINKAQIVNPHSNYCFGEGGAGTYSDGKLYTRSKKRGDIRRILEILVRHGAQEEILIEAHPHIGTNKLPKIVENLRQSIIDAGGEVHFDTQVIDLIIDKAQIKGVITQNQDTLKGIGVILATGHSARDIFQLLAHKKIHIEAKPFALGVRVEHNQMLINEIQYKKEAANPYLPAAAYSWVEQVDHNQQQKGVFSFCMCPGGFIVPSATAMGEVVVNGMSPSRRNSKFANSGIVVSVEWADLKPYWQYEALAALHFQQEVEQKACHIAGGTQKAPAQRLEDFVNKKVSDSLLITSYQPGLVSVDMDSVLPAWIANSLRKGFKAIGKKMKGYLSNEAQIVGVESRTSSPVKIPRDKDTWQHPQIKGLFPCGEGAGYAGGIMSAAIDGEKCAEKLQEWANG
ncbi:MAG: FAD-binding protein [Cytophagales bacterium]|nr:MAG: FAD-binding protein [Cytophagales bacterium]